MILNKATDEAEDIIITRKNEKNVVLLSLEKYNQLIKTVRNAEFYIKLTIAYTIKIWQRTATRID